MFFPSSTSFVLFLIFSRTESVKFSNLYTMKNQYNIRSIDFCFAYLLVNLVLFFLLPLMNLCTIDYNSQESYNPQIRTSILLRLNYVSLLLESYMVKWYDLFLATHYKSFMESHPPFY